MYVVCANVLAVSRSLFSLISFVDMTVIVMEHSGSWGKPRWWIFSRKFQWVFRIRNKISLNKKTTMKYWD